MMTVMAWLSLATSFALLVLILGACIIQWRSMRPSQRLFAEAFTLYVLISLMMTGATINPHWVTQTVLFIRLTSLVVANVLLLVATFALHREWREQHPHR